MRRGWVSAAGGGKQPGLRQGQGLALLCICFGNRSQIFLVKPLNPKRPKMPVPKSKREGGAGTIPTS